MEFDKLITRLDEISIQQIIGKEAIGILNTIDPQLARLQRIQGILLAIYPPVTLIQNKKFRNLLFEVLKEEEAFSLAERIGIKKTGDVYENLKAINFNRTDERILLFNFFGVDFPLEIEIEQKPFSSEVPCQYPLFPHQRNAVKEVFQKLYVADRRVLLHMPTGAGKTRTAMNVISAHLRNNDPTVVIWFANTEELCEQAFEEFSKAWSNLGDREITTIRYWGKSKVKIGDIQDGIIIAGLAKIYELLKGDIQEISKLASRASLIIMDEAHMAVAPTYKTILNILTSAGASLLGLSATPGRTWNDPTADEELSLYFRKKKVTLKIPGFSNSVDYLIQKGYLAKINNRSLLYKSGLQISEADTDHLRDFLQLPDDVLKAMSKDQKRNILIVQEVERLTSRHHRIILFAINVDHANLLATVLQARGINAFSITSNTDSFRRKSLIDRFKASDEVSMVLCNYGILTTGFDAPKTSCAVIARPTDSLVLYSQMVGRAIRGVNAGGNAEAEIVTVVDTSLPGFDHVASAFFNWEDVWE